MWEKIVRPMKRIVEAQGEMRGRWAEDWIVMVSMVDSRCGLYEVAVMEGSLGGLVYRYEGRMGIFVCRDFAIEQLSNWRHRVQSMQYPEMDVLSSKRF